MSLVKRPSSHPDAISDHKEKNRRDREESSDNYCDDSSDSAELPQLVDAEAVESDGEYANGDTILTESRSDHIRWTAIQRKKDPAVSKNGNFFPCPDCRRSFDSETQRVQHLHSLVHQKAQRRELLSTQRLHCTVCGISSFTSEVQYSSHCTGRRHRQRLHRYREQTSKKKGNK